VIEPEWNLLVDWIRDLGGFGGFVFTMGNGFSRVFGRFYFMNMVLGMLFLVRRTPKVDEEGNERGKDLSREESIDLERPRLRRKT